MSQASLGVNISRMISLLGSGRAQEKGVVLGPSKGKAGKTLPRKVIIASRRVPSMAHGRAMRCRFPAR
jgi:hypothetical protein